ncbi:RCC1-like domain-containing protein [Planococcus beijingensis]
MLSNLFDDVSDWHPIVETAASYLHSVGLRSDGTMSATGRNDERVQCQ